MVCATSLDAILATFKKCLLTAQRHLLPHQVRRWWTLTCQRFRRWTARTFSFHRSIKPLKKNRGRTGISSPPVSSRYNVMRELLCVLRNRVAHPRGSRIVLEHAFQMVIGRALPASTVPATRETGRREESARLPDRFLASFGRLEAPQQQGRKLDTRSTAELPIVLDHFVA